MNSDAIRKTWTKVIEAMPTVDRLTKDVGGSEEMLPVAVVCMHPGSRMLERLCRIGARIATGPDGSVVAVLPHSRHFLFSAEFPGEGVRALMARAAGKQLLLVQSATQMLRLQVPPCPHEREVMFDSFHARPRLAA
jgi:hypothetical protein